VLTTAAVVDGTGPSGLSVEAGSSLLGSGTAVPVSNYSKNSEFGAGVVTYSNDIAIIYLATPLTFSDSIQPAMLPASDQDQFVGTTAAVTGWWTQGCPGIMSNSSAMLAMEVIPNSQAQALLSTIAGANIWDKQLCLLDPAQQVTPGARANGTGIYAFDGSGHLVLIGLYSWGIPSIIPASPSSCMLPSYPAIGTRTSAYLDWIAQNASGGVGSVSSPFVNQAHSKPGTDGKSPMLIASGPMTAGSVITLTLINAKPNSGSFLFYGFSLGNVPFKGGVMVPGNAKYFPFILGIDAAGTLSMSDTWPSGAAGASIYLQHWVFDAGATSGFSASNGLQVIGQ